MDLTFLGTASAYPTPTRGVSCIILRNSGVYWMFDCGEGSQTQLMKSNIRPGKISKIFISHLHGDHLFGLPGLLCTISQNFSSESKTIVEIYGPEGLRRYLRESLSLSRSLLGFDYVVHELKPRPEQYRQEWEDWAVDHNDIGPLHPSEHLGKTIECNQDLVYDLCTDNGMSVKAGCLSHRVPSFGYVIEEEPQLGRLNPEKLKSRGIPPGPLYAKIKHGEPVEAPDGSVISPGDVLDEPRPARKVSIMMDTCDSSKMAEVCSDSDVIVYEATLGNDMEARAIEKTHSTPGMAGRFARDVRAKALILTHFSQRFRPASAEIKEGEDSVQVLLDQGIEAFGSERVITAEDLLNVSVPVPNSQFQKLSNK